MKGRANWFYRLYWFLFAFSFIPLQAWASAANVGPIIQLDFFDRTNATSGFIVTRYINTWSESNERYFTGARLVPSGVTNQWMGIEGTNIIRVQSAGVGKGEATIETVPGLDPDSTPIAIAFDSTRARVVVAMTGGTLFQRSASQPWSQLSRLDDIDFVALLYSPKEDVFWGVKKYQGAPDAFPAFSKLSSQGVGLTNFTIGVQRPDPNTPGLNITTGLFTNVVPGGYHAELAFASYDIVELLVERPHDEAIQPADKSGRYELNSSGYFYAREFTPGAPIVQLVSPSTPQRMLVNTPINVYISASDSDGNLRKVQLRDNGILLKEWTFDSTNDTTIKGLDFAWTASSTGLHTLAVRAEDWLGFASETSGTVNMEVILSTRSFPYSIHAGQSFSVTLQAMPTAGAPPWTLRELPPANWPVSVGNGASSDPETHEIVWGPFSDSQNRTLTYQLTAPAIVSSSNFTGSVSVNGGLFQALDSTWISVIPPRAPTIQIDAWGFPQGTQHPVGTPIPAAITASDADDDLQSVELLWNGTLIESWAFNPTWDYGYNHGMSPHWAPAASGQYTFTVRAKDSLGNVTTASATVVYNIDDTFVYVSRNTPTNVVAGQSFTVQIHAYPSPSSHPWIVKEQPPSDWTVMVDGDATVDPITHEITWGPFENPTVERAFAYDVIAPTANTFGGFQGRSIMDGIATPISGPTNVYTLPPTVTVVRRIDENHIAFRFNATPGVRYKLEATDSLDSSNWIEISGIIIGTDAPLEFGPLAVGPEQKFYRLSPAF